MAPPPSSAGQMANGSSTGGGGGGMTNMNHPHRMMMHMTFFWSKNTDILFSGWPGYDNLGMYVLALVVVFSLAVLVEWFSHSNVIGKKHRKLRGWNDSDGYVRRKNWVGLFGDACGYEF